MEKKNILLLLPLLIALVLVTASVCIAQPYHHPETIHLDRLNLVPGFHLHRLDLGQNYNVAALNPRIGRRV